MIGIYYSFFGVVEGGLYLVSFLVFVWWLAGKKYIRENFFTVLVFSFLLIAAYCFLLPLGGCRDYRPYILRRDTFLPALSVLLILVSACTIYILEQKDKRTTKPLFITWIVLALVYWSLDRMPVWYDDNELEKKNLYQLQSSTEDCTTLKEGLSVFSWNNYSACDQSYISSALLLHYRIIDRYREYKNQE
jgi:apolipoprotein N-acyltransferase